VMSKAKTVKPPCGHSAVVRGYGAYGKPGDCIIAYPGTNLGCCSACGAIFRRTTPTSVWQEVPKAKRRQIRRTPPVNALRLPGMGLDEVDEGREVSK
jgi:hypothetical protein